MCAFSGMSTLLFAERLWSKRWSSKGINVTRATLICHWPLTFIMGTLYLEQETGTEKPLIFSPISLINTLCYKPPQYYKKCFYPLQAHIRSLVASVDFGAKVCLKQLDRSRVDRLHILLLIIFMDFLHILNMVALLCHFAFALVIVMTK